MHSFIVSIPEATSRSGPSIAYECLTGKAPFEADNIAKVVFRIAYEPHQPLKARAPHVPDAMSAAVEHALEKEREKRTISVAAFVLELTGQVLTSAASFSPVVAPSQPTNSGVLKPGQSVDEQMMAQATVAPPSNIAPKPVLATPNPAPPEVVVPPPPQPSPVAPPAPPRSPMAFVVGGLALVGVAVGGFFIARAVDPSARVVDAGVAAPVAVVDAGVVALVVDAGVEAVVDAGAPGDAGALVALADAGVSAPKVTPKALAPPSAADLEVLAELKAQADAGKLDDVWARRGPLRSRFSSKEGLRDFLIFMTGIACQRGDLGSANFYARQLDEFPPAALDAARKRCRKHQDWPLD